MAHLPAGYENLGRENDDWVGGWMMNSVNYIDASAINHSHHSQTSSKPNYPEAPVNHTKTNMRIIFPFNPNIPVYIFPYINSILYKSYIQYIYIHIPHSIYIYICIFPILYESHIPHIFPSQNILDRPVVSRGLTD